MLPNGDLDELIEEEADVTENVDVLVDEFAIDIEVEVKFVEMECESTTVSSDAAIVDEESFLTMRCWSLCGDASRLPKGSMSELRSDVDSRAGFA